MIIPERAEAEALLNQFGFRFSISTTSKARADGLKAGFNELGLACRITDVSGTAIQLGWTEYKITWWQKGKQP